MPLFIVECWNFLLSAELSLLAITVHLRILLPGVELPFLLPRLRLGRAEPNSGPPELS
jgi:hypothetical protein